MRRHEQRTQGGHQAPRLLGPGGAPRRRPGHLPPVADSDGSAWARERGGGKRAGGGHRAAGKHQRSASKIDRKPRAAKADRGSIRKASAPKRSAARPARGRQKPTAKPQGATRDRVASREKSRTKRDASKRQQISDRQAKDRAAGRRPDLAGGKAGDQQAKLDRLKAKDREAAGEDRAESSPNARKIGRGPRGAQGAAAISGGSHRAPRERRDRAEQREERKEDIAQRREDRREEIADRRKDWQENREDRREDRKEALEELQENRQDFIKDVQENRQDFVEDLADERRDVWEDVYDDNDFWGDWDDDDDNEWLWGIVGGVAGYVIGAAVNSPPEGTVPVAGYPTYQYYGGAFYQPAPSGKATSPPLHRSARRWRRPRSTAPSFSGRTTKATATSKAPSSPTTRGRTTISWPSRLSGRRCRTCPTGMR